MAVNVGEIEGDLQIVGRQIQVLPQAEVRPEVDVEQSQIEIQNAADAQVVVCCNRQTGAFDDGPTGEAVNIVARGNEVVRL